MSLVVAVLGALGLLEQWGLSADDVAMLCGAVLSIAATARALLDRGE